MKLNVDQKIVSSIDTTLLDTLLANIVEEDWHSNDYRKHAFGMSNCNSIPLRHTDLCLYGLSDDAVIKSIRPYPAYYKLQQYLNPILLELKKYYSYDNYAAFIARLSPQSIIDCHVDKGIFLEACHRVHVPLQTNSNVKYIIDGAEYYWEKGNIYEFDNTRLHGVKNLSDEYRIHLVINLYPN